MIYIYFLDTCGIFTGLPYEYNISNSIIKNINNQNASPAISNSKNAKFYISNTSFTNFT